MKQSRIEEIVSAFTKNLGLDSGTIRMICSACCEVERETRHECVSAAYTLANRLALSPREQETKSP